MRIFGFALQVLGGVILLLGGAAGLFFCWYNSVLAGDLSYLTTRQWLNHIFLIYTLPWLAPVSVGGVLYFLGRMLRPKRLAG